MHAKKEISIKKMFLLVILVLIVPLIACIIAFNIFALVNKHEYLRYQRYGGLC